MFYFTFFPSVQYKDSDNVETTSIDITKRFKFIDSVIKNKYIFYEYIVKDGERADIIADKYYGDTRLDWLIFLMNVIVDPFFQWPMSYFEFQDYIKKKYDTIEYAMQTVKYYYKIIQTEQVLFDGTKIEERKVIIDQTEYNTLNAEERDLITIYEWEKEENNKRKSIKLIDKIYLPKILDEVNSIF